MDRITGATATLTQTPKTELVPNKKKNRMCVDESDLNGGPTSAREGETSTRTQATNRTRPKKTPWTDLNHEPHNARGGAMATLTQTRSRTRPKKPQMCVDESDLNHGPSNARGGATATLTQTRNRTRPNKKEVDVRRRV